MHKIGQKVKARLGGTFFSGIVVANYKEDKDDQYHIFSLVTMKFLRLKPVT